MPKYQPKALQVIMMLVLMTAALEAQAAGPATQKAANPLSAVHRGHQRLITAYAKTCIVIGDQVWSIEQKKKLEELEKRKALGRKKLPLKAYQAKDAPIYYHLKTGKRAPDLLQAAAISLPQYRLVTGRVVESHVRVGARFKLGGRDAMLLDHPLVAAGSTLPRTLAKRSGKYTYITDNGLERSIVAYRAVDVSDHVRPAIPGDIVRVLATQDRPALVRFRPKKVVLKRPTIRQTKRTVGNVVVRETTRTTEAEWGWEWQEVKTPIRLVAKKPQ